MPDNKKYQNEHSNSEILNFAEEKLSQGPQRNEVFFVFLAEKRQSMTISWLKPCSFCDRDLVFQRCNPNNLYKVGPTSLFRYKWSDMYSPYKWPYN